MTKAARKPKPDRFAGLYPHLTVHVLGRQPGMTLCGKKAEESPANPVHGLWGSKDERQKAAAALSDAMSAAVTAFPGLGEPCKGCEANVARMAGVKPGKGGAK